MLIKKFSRYSLIGVFNTAVHWSVFGLVMLLVSSQALANGLGFLVAATVSYFLNAKWTFQQATDQRGYVVFMLGMGSISVLVGYLGDLWLWPGLVTLIVFSFISLILGFAWSHFWVFKSK